MSGRRGEVWVIGRRDLLCHHPGNTDVPGGTDLPGDTDVSGDTARSKDTERAVVIVSADGLGESAAGVLLVVPMTTSRWNLPTHVAIESGASGLGSVHFARCEDLTSIPSVRLIRRLGVVSADALAQTGRVLAMLLDL